jgi:hypothetical protein
MMVEAWLLYAAVETDSSSYEAGQIVGQILVAALAVAVVWAIIRRIRNR